MNRNRMILGALALVFAMAAPASAGLEVGAEATDFNFDGTFNTEPINLSELKGRVVLLELWKTTWGPCIGQVGHLNKLQEEFESKGFTIVAVTHEEKEIVEPAVEKYGMSYPILCKGQAGAYSTGGVPAAYLIGANGNIVWQGHPGSLSNDEIETQLKEVDKANRVSTWAFRIASQLGEVPEALSGVKKLLEKMKFGQALKKVEGSLAKLEGDDKEAGEKVRAWIAKSGEGGIEEAAGLVRDGQIYKAFLKYEEITERFKGHDLSKQAKTAAGALKKGKETKLEIKASEKLEAIKKEMRDERKAEDRLALLKPMLSKKYAETLAGKQAAEMAAELEKGGAAK